MQRLAFTPEQSRIVAALTLSVLSIIASARAGAQSRPVDFVNTLRGSASKPEYSHGNTFPAVSVPFGFNFWTPITEPNSQAWLYRYDRNTVQGFGVSHEPSPWVHDHGSIQIMPEVGTLQVAPDARGATFQHSSETAQPHYYAVSLDSSSIRVELTPTDHASRFRFTFPSTENAYLLFDSVDQVPGNLQVQSDARTIQGYVDDNGPRLYFVARVDQPIVGVQYPTGAGVTAAIRFDTRSTAVVELSMATSFVSLEQAELNLDTEIGARGFDEIRSAAATQWNDVLGSIEVEGATDRQLITLYSNLYRAFLYPNSMYEWAGDRAIYYSPYDDQVHDGKIWVNNGFWDTYRAAWPLYVLLMPERAGEMLNGFVRAYLDGGWTPRWSGPGYLDVMVGTHTDSAFADAYAKSVRNFDVDNAYVSMLKNALVASPSGALGRKGNEQSIFKGYVPTSVRESAAWSLENAVNDHSIAQLATARGDTLHARYFRSRALRYTDLFSSEVGFFRGRTIDGEWRTSDADFHAEEWGYEFTEGNAWQYSLAANHDPEGMARLYGGRAALSEKIDALFAAPRNFLPGSYGQVIHEMTEAYDTNLGQYAHANEPTHHILYMYNYAGTPWKTQQRVRDVLDEARNLYGPGIGDGTGYLGDEDNGQMSAWFVWSALGFYPASPGHAEYAIGSPLFTRATIHLAGARTFVISAPANSADNVYVQSATLNGQPLTRNFLTHAEISAGGELQLALGPVASSWGSEDGSVPTSLTPPGAQLSALRDCARDGTSSAGGSSAQLPANNAFDDDSRTEWQGSAAGAWLAYQFAGDQACAVSVYTLTSGREADAADVRSWQLQAADADAHWVTVDSRTDEHFEWRQQTRVFEIASPRPARAYRLLAEANGGAAFTRVAEVELLAGDSDPPSVSDSDGGTVTARPDDAGPKTGTERDPVARRDPTNGATMPVELDGSSAGGRDAAGSIADAGAAPSVAPGRDRNCGCAVREGTLTRAEVIGSVCVCISVVCRLRRHRHKRPTKS